MSHTCHAQSCPVEVPPKMFMCKRHWYMLPKAYRDAVWAAYRPGQEDTKNPSVSYLEVTKIAIEYISNKETQNASS